MAALEHRDGEYCFSNFFVLFTAKGQSSQNKNKLELYYKDFNERSVFVVVLVCFSSSD